MKQSLDNDRWLDTYELTCEALQSALVCLAGNDDYRHEEILLRAALHRIVEYHQNR